jgi:predicted glycogen debranching enzyme
VHGTVPGGRDILRTFAQYVRDGLIPNMFPDSATEGLYHTADATLWFFPRGRAIPPLHRRRRASRGAAADVSRHHHHHLRGTRFGIGVDPADGLLRQGAEGYQLTWMDAKVGDWVVTPRRGKAVELNALWYNALRLLEAGCRDAGDADCRPSSHATRIARTSFNRRFWYEEGGYLYDVVDGETAMMRVPAEPDLRRLARLSGARRAALGTRAGYRIGARLLTPVGLRSLAPDTPITSRATGEICGRATPPTIRAPCGAG